MCRASAEASEPPAGQRRVNGDEAVLAHEERHLRDLPIGFKGRGSDHAKGDENKRSRPLGGFLHARRMCVVVELQVSETAADLCGKVDLLVRVASNCLADCEWLMTRSGQINCSDQTV